MKVIIAILIVVLSFALPSQGVNWVPCDVFTNASSTDWIANVMERHQIANIYQAAHRMKKSKEPFHREKILSQVYVFKSAVKRDVSDLAAQCTKVNVTLARGGSNTQTIQFFVKRIYLNNGQNPSACTKQIWLNQGGPGASGIAMERIAPELSRTFPTACIYVPDHRGTGRSTYVDCLTSETLAQCQSRMISTWGSDGATSFTPREAANDIAEFMQMMISDEGQTEVHLYGVSYGTYLVNRFLQLHPTLTDTNLIDGIVDPVVGFLNEPLERLDPAGRVIFNRCGQDEFCASKLGADPIAFAFSVYDKITNGHCAVLGFDRILLKQVVTAVSVLGLHSFNTALLYRLDRCADEDLTAITRMFNWLVSKLNSGVSYEVQDSNYVFNLIGINEMYNASNTPVVLAQQEPNAIYWSTYGETLYNTTQLWTTYYNEPYAGYRASGISGAFLMLNGDLDLQTPVSWPEAYYAGTPISGARFYVVENAGHGTVFGGVIANSPTNQTCGMNLMISMIQSGTAPTTAPCITATRPIDFTGASILSQISGLGDFYENVDSGSLRIASSFVIVVIALISSF